MSEKVFLRFFSMFRGDGFCYVALTQHMEIEEMGHGCRKNGSQIAQMKISSLVIKF